MVTVISGNQIIPLRDDSKQGANEQRLVLPVPDLDFSAANEYVIDISFQQIGLTFANPRTLFVDNTTNPSVIDVTISGTNQKFPVPAYTAGYFAISAQVGSKIDLQSAGGATGPVHVSVYNYPIPSVTWNAASASVIVVGTVATSVADGADVALGATADAAVTNPASPGSVIALLKGIISTLLTAGISIIPKAGTPKGYEQIVGMVASTALTVPSGATYALITVEGADCRWRDDGVAPTAGVGMPLYQGQAAFLFNGNLAALRFIEMAASATLNISYYS